MTAGILEKDCRRLNQRQGVTLVEWNLWLQQWDLGLQNGVVVRENQQKCEFLFVRSLGECFFNVKIDEQSVSKKGFLARHVV